MLGKLMSFSKLHVDVNQNWNSNFSHRINSSYSIGMLNFPGLKYYKYVILSSFLLFVFISYPVLEYYEFLNLYDRVTMT